MYNTAKNKVRSGRQAYGVNLAAQHLPHGGSDMTAKCLSVFIKTFGCQMNVRDSEIVAGMLEARGYARAGSVEEADVVLFNTCSVRRQAEQRAWSNVGMVSPRICRPAASKSERGDNHHDKKIVGVIGCMAQNYQGEIFRRFPYVNLVCGPANIYDIPDALEKIIKDKTQVLAVDRTQRPLRKGDVFTGGLKAFVSIMYGCNNFCTYCIVPYVRGREKSRPLTHILSEVKDLAQRGCKEVTLLGQNVNSYGKGLRGKVDFVRLLRKLDRIKGIERIRFITSHPKDASKDLFKAMRDLPKVCEHLHLPLQSGSGKILKLMSRGYTMKDYLESVDCLRSLIPHCSLSSDIIVGFPGESKADFQKTIRAMQRLQFDEAFIFKYSPRPGTKAAQLKDDVPLQVKRQRNQALLRLQEGISLRKNRRLLGKPIEVLTEGLGDKVFVSRARTQTMLKGRSRTNKVTLFAGKKDLIFRTVNVRIDKVTTHTLIGRA